MADYDEPSRRRSTRDRRPRYDASESSDDYEPRRSSRRIPPPPRGVHAGGLSETKGGLPGRGRPAIVDDPDETPPSSRQMRAKSNVRIKSESDSDDGYVRRDRGAEAPRRPRPSRHDMERKNSKEQQQFRERRSGYLSDEGETHKRALKRNSGRKRDSDSEDNGKLSRSTGLAGLLGAALPHRSKGRSTSENPPYPAERSREVRRGDYDTEPDHRPRRRRNDEDYDEPPRRRRTENPRRSDGYAYGGQDDDRGYRSDHGGRRRRDDYARPPAYERDPYERRRDDGYRSDHGPRPRPRRNTNPYDDYGEDRYRRSDPRSRDPYGGGGRDRYYDDDRRDPYRERGSRGAGKRGGKNWQKEAGAIFASLASNPTIRREGTKFLQQQAQAFMAKKKAGGGGFPF